MASYCERSRLMLRFCLGGAWMDCNSPSHSFVFIRDLCDQELELELATNLSLRIPQKYKKTDHRRF